MGALKQGDRVAIVSCSSPFDRVEFDRGLAWYRQRLHVVDDPRWHGRDGFLAGSDEDRASMLMGALEDPSVRCVLSARGGYGAMRVLERVGDHLVRSLARDPKPVVGFSDVTAFHAAWARAGVRSVHASMVAALGRAEGHRDALWSILQGEVSPPWEGLTPLRTRALDDAEAVARGGNLALLASLVGTPWQMDLAGAVLFLEDITEKPYRVDRMLTTLRLAGALRGVAAVVLGEFTQCDPAADGVTVERVFRDRLGDLGVPVLMGAPFGHGEVNRPWVCGARVRVEADAGRVVFLEGIGA